MIPAAVRRERRLNWSRDMPGSLAPTSGSWAARRAAGAKVKHTKLQRRSAVFRDGRDVHFRVYGAYRLETAEFGVSSRHFPKPEKL